MNDILNQIWQLPWYQVLWITFVVIGILILKIWPFWIAVGAFFIGIGIRG